MNLLNIFFIFIKLGIMDFYLLNTDKKTLIIADCTIYEYPRKYKKPKETNAIIVDKYMNVAEIIKTVNDIKKLKKTAKGKVQERVRINQPCKPCLPDNEPDWEFINKHEVEEQNYQKRPVLTDEYKKLYDF